MNRGTDAAILIAEDDDEDFLLAQKAFEHIQLGVTLHRVHDGEELMEFLRQRARQGGAAKDSIVLLLLDLNMPRKDGREALREIKSSPELRSLPVVVLTTSRTPEDVALAYQLGVNSFIRKPFSFPELVETIASLTKYWLEVVELPFPKKARSLP